MTKARLNKATELEESEALSDFIDVEEGSLFYGCPRHVFVGSMRIEIHVMNGDVAMVGGLMGMAQPDNGRLYLAQHEHPQALANTAIHEVIHCINRNRSVRDGDSEEHVTDQIATGLCDFRVFNPLFFLWWEELLLG